MNFKKILLASLVILFVFTCFGGYFLFLIPNVVNEKNLYIDKDDNMDSIVFKLTSGNIINSKSSFIIASKILKYSNPTIKSGRYILTTEMSNFTLVRKLRSGSQDPVQVIIQNGRYINDFISQVSSQLMLDSTDLHNYLNSDEFLNTHGITYEETLTLFIPNSYEFYWDSGLSNVINRLVKEGDKFWTNNQRTEKIRNLGLNRKEAYILASIVEKESQHKDELATIAGLYLNRLRINMPLQADPTVVFASGNFDLRRVLNIHLLIDSPYNTYKYTGLPPGPICMPSLNSLNAVINSEKHNYLYMCAKPGYEGKHLFAETFNQHINNANKYRLWLEKEGIK